MSLPTKDHYDAIVVGARCAGAATAMLLSRAGRRVLCVDRSPYGSDTLSTHALMRTGVLQLRRWGLLDRLVATGAPPLRSTSFHYGQDLTVVPIGERHGVDALYAPRRTVLDALLVDAARESGAEVRHRTAVSALHRDGSGRVTGVRLHTHDGGSRDVRARLVIGADGARSKVARIVGAERYLTTGHTTATIYGYFSHLGVDDYRWYFGSRVSAGTIPTHDGVCVFVATTPERFHAELRFDLESSFRRLLAEAAPDLVEALGGARRDGRLRGFAGQVGFLRQCHGPGWALVGDAGYFKDPATAHGISDALRDAELLVRAYVHGGEAGLTDYQTTRDALSSSLLAHTDAIASFEWDTAELQRLHKALSKDMAREATYLSLLDEGFRLAG